MFLAAVVMLLALPAGAFAEVTFPGDTETSFALRPVPASADCDLTTSHVGDFSIDERHDCSTRASRFVATTATLSIGSAPALPTVSFDGSIKLAGDLASADNKANTFEVSFDEPTHVSIEGTTRVLGTVDPQFRAVVALYRLASTGPPQLVLSHQHTQRGLQEHFDVRTSVSAPLPPGDYALEWEMRAEAGGTGDPAEVRLQFLFNAQCVLPTGAGDLYVANCHANGEDAQLTGAACGLHQIADFSQGSDTLAFARASQVLLKRQRGTLVVPPGNYIIDNQCPAAAAACGSELYNCSCGADNTLTLFIHSAFRPESGALLHVENGVRVELRGEVIAGPRHFCEEERQFTPGELPPEKPNSGCFVGLREDQVVDRIYAEWWGAIGGRASQSPLPGEHLEFPDGVILDENGAPRLDEKGAPRVRSCARPCEQDQNDPTNTACGAACTILQTECSEPCGLQNRTGFKDACLKRTCEHLESDPAALAQCRTDNDAACSDEADQDCAGYARRLDECEDDSWAVQRALQESGKSGQVVGLPKRYRVCGLTVGGGVKWVGTGLGATALVNNTPPDVSGSTIYHSLYDCELAVAELRDSVTALVSDIGFYGNRGGIAGAYCPAEPLAVLPSSFNLPIAPVNFGVPGCVWIHGGRNDAGDVGGSTSARLTNVATFNCVGSGVLVGEANNLLLDNVISSNNSGHGFHFYRRGSSIHLNNPVAERSSGAGMCFTHAYQDGAYGGVTVISPWLEENATYGIVQNSASCLTVVGGRDVQSGVGSVLVEGRRTACTTIEGLEMRYQARTPTLPPGVPVDVANALAEEDPGNTDQVVVADCAAVPTLRSVRSFRSGESKMDRADVNVRNSFLKCFRLRAFANLSSASTLSGVPSVSSEASCVPPSFPSTR